MQIHSQLLSKFAALFEPADFVRMYLLDQYRVHQTSRKEPASNPLRQIFGISKILGGLPGGL